MVLVSYKLFNIYRSINTNEAGPANAQRLRRSPPLTVSHHHGLLTPPLAAATAAPERATLRGGSRRNPSIQPPSRACRASTAWPSPCHGWAEAAAEADVSWREAGKNY